MLSAISDSFLLRTEEMPTGWTAYHPPSLMWWKWKCQSAWNGLLIKPGIAQINNLSFRNKGKKNHAENLYWTQFVLNQNLWHNMSVAYYRPLD
jgi:hypothetical protein